MGRNLPEDSYGLLGQMIVEINPDAERPKTAGLWDVELKGTREMLNGFGARADIPVVRFWGFHQGENSSAQARDTASSQGDVPDSGAKRTVAGVLLRPYDLMKNPYSHEGQVVQFEWRDTPRFVNGGFADFFQYGGWDLNAPLQPVGLRLDRMVSRNQALYNIMGITIGGKPYADVIGQLLVELGPRTAPPSDNDTWNVEPLGTTRFMNRLGGPVDIPTVQFHGVHNAK